MHSRKLNPRVENKIERHKHILDLFVHEKWIRKLSFQKKLDLKTMLSLKMSRSLWDILIYMVYICVYEYICVCIYAHIWFIIQLITLLLISWFCSPTHNVDRVPLHIFEHCSHEVYPSLPPFYSRGNWEGSTNSKVSTDLAQQKCV